jgi:hypothetical protein
MAFVKKKQPTRAPVGAVRRAQMITTYGVGSMVAIGDQSFIVSGIDSWKVDDSFAIFEPRLQAWLGVDGFRLPPSYDPPIGDGVKVRQFPTIYSCSSCNELKPFRKFGSPAGKSICVACEKPLTPSRFVVACENGHLDDFPYFEWVHKKTERSEELRDHALKLKSTGRTASLRSILIECSCGKSASLEGAFGKRALDALGIRCKGLRPWLGKGHEQDCSAMPRTLQRGSSAAWFPVNRSALSIPPYSSSLFRRVNEQFTTFSNLLDAGERNAAQIVIRSSGMLKGSSFTEDDVLEAVELLRKLKAKVKAEADSHGNFEPAGKLRREEYEQLRIGTGTVARDEEFECVKPADDPSAPLPFGIDRVRLVKRLREVRALHAFTRVQAPDAHSETVNPAAIAAEQMDWLPAIEVRGEGVFMTLDRKKLADWAEYQPVRDRVDRIRKNHTAAMRRRAAEENAARAAEIVSPVDAPYVLLHTLAHA